MGLGNEDKKIVFCIAERQSSHENTKGFIKPIFEETVDGLTPVNQEDFIKNGFIYVTKGYNKFLNTQDGQFYRVEVNVYLRCCTRLN